MLTRFAVKGFKSLVDVELPLSQVTVLVGPNNAGKSNILKALDFLARVIREDLGRVITLSGGLDAIRSKARQIPLEFSLSARFDSWQVDYELRPPQNTDQGVERFSATGPAKIEAWWTTQGIQFNLNGASERVGGGWVGSTLSELARSGKCEPAMRLHSFLAGMTVADFSPSALREASQVIPNAVLEHSGRNLAAVLDLLDGTRPDVRARIDDAVRTAVPSVTRVVTVPADQAGFKTLGIAEGSAAFRAEHVSDGILLFIALSTVAQMSGGKTVVGLEEPDKGIHPRRIREILDQVYRVANEGSQFLITTHSPVLLNEFKDHPEAVLIVERDEQGTHVSQLSQQPDLEEQLRNVQLGDLWFSGVLGGVPKR